MDVTFTDQYKQCADRIRRIATNHTNQEQPQNPLHRQSLCCHEMTHYILDQKGYKMRCESHLPAVAQLILSARVLAACLGLVSIFVCMPISCTKTFEYVAYLKGRSCQIPVIAYSSIPARNCKFRVSMCCGKSEYLLLWQQGKQLPLGPPEQILPGKGFPGPMVQCKKSQ